MKVVIQRVSKASVSVDEKIVGEIESGLLLLIGVGYEDTEEKAIALAEKISKLRVMADKNNKMNLSVIDSKASILAISQFTLYADTSKGNRPSFVKAADPKLAMLVYEAFCKKLISLDINVQKGSFGEYMRIDAILDGPVTINIEI